MNHNPTQLRQDALSIWTAGVDAVRSERLVADAVTYRAPWLRIGELELRLDRFRRILVVGGGKAGAGMATALEEILVDVGESGRLEGWIHVPADCVRPTRWLHLHAARPAGSNEPTAEGVAGMQHILRLLEQAGPDDLCLCLLSGGGSALLPCPPPEISLADKIHVTRFLSAAGANIRQLNTVRKHLSLVKGGGLARVYRGRLLVTLLISDVLGDPLDLIASGPTVDDDSTPEDALAVLRKFDYAADPHSGAVLDCLKRRTASAGRWQLPIAELHHFIIGNNATAVDAAGVVAEQLGYTHAMQTARQLEGPAEKVGRRLARVAESMCRQSGPDCLISGGEPVVQLADPAIRGLGGRNQQLVLAAYEYLNRDSAWSLEQLALLSGGTDGEDGPTDAAGAWIDPEVARTARQLGLDPHAYLARNDAYHFFEQTGGLLKTGPTHTNVCDLRVVLTARSP